MLISVAIMGALTSIATPPLLNNLHRAKQSDAASLLSQLAVSAATYKDEFGEAPTTWEHLSEISAVMTANGPADTSDGELIPSDTITSANGDFTINRSSGTGDYFEFTATPTRAGAAARYNVVSCIDLSNGASDIRLGGRNGLADEATTGDLTCKKSIPSPNP